MTVSSAAPSSIISLRSVNGLPCAKSFVRKDKKIAVTGYGNESHWDAEVHEAHDLTSLAAVLDDLSHQTDRIVVCGRLLDESNREGIQRRLYGDGASLAPAERQWLAVDVDAGELPWRQDTKPNPAEMLRWWWKEYLPKPLRSVSCWYQWTSGYGVGKPLNIIRARFWFWLDRPVHTEALRLWAKAQEFVDPAVFVACQPIYVARPIFGADITPPVADADRCGILRGLTAEASTEAMELATFERMQARCHAAGSTVRRADVVPNEGEIAAAIAKIESSVTTGARHHHMLGAVCELYALGADPVEIAEVCNELIRKQGREPQVNEVENALKYAEKKDREGALTVSKQPLCNILGADDTDAAVTPIAAGTEEPEDEDAEDDLEEDLERMNDLRSENENAKVFLMTMAKAGGDVIRWAERDWFWTGKNWSPSENGEALAGRIMATAEEHGAAMNATRVKNIGACVRLLRAREALSLPCWLGSEKTGSHAIVCQNGMVFVDDAIMDPHHCLQPHERDYFSTTLLPYDYDPDAKCPTWERCMREWFPEDAQSRREIQKMFGYLLVPDNQFEKFFVLTDRQGRAGKGTMVTALSWLIGEENADATSFSGLGKDFGLANAVGKSVILLNEANAQHDRDVPALAIDRIKMVTGGDRVEIEKKGVDSLTAKLSARFVMSCNRPPKLRDASGALLKRMHLIEFKQTFFGRENTRLKDRSGPLFRELSGILNWAIEGLKMLYFEDKGFIRPEASAEYFADMRRASAPIQAFTEDCMVLGSPAELSTPKEHIYKVYRAWCREAAGIDRPMTREAFFSELRQVLPHRVEVRESGASALAWRGVDLSELAHNLAGGREAMLGD